MDRTKILVVEDENIVALDLRNQLEKNGFIVSGIVSSGESAIEHSKKELPELVLMDIQLQGELDGIETAKIIKEKFNIPVVFITAFADDTTFQRAKNIDPFGYIIKPFEERILRTTIEMAIYKARIDSQLIQSEERYRNFFENDLSGDFVADPEGNIIECNSAFVSMFSFPTIEETKKVNIGTLFKSNDKKSTFWQNLLQKRKLELMELSLLTYTGEKVDVLANVIAEPMNGDIREIRGYLINTTERNQLEAQLRHAQKMEALGRLAGGVAHDFNNILTVIMGYSSMMEEKLNTGIPIAQDIEGIQTAAKKAVNLTRQLLVFSRKHTFRPIVVDVNKLISDMEKMLRRLIHENISMNFFLNADNPHVYIDPGQMEQVLINLVVNAKDAMPGGGKLIIETSNYHQDRIKEQETNIPEQRYVKVTIEDTGIGIDDKIKSKIFEPFFTTKPEDQGTGLGLSTAYAIINQSNGYIDVESDIGEGTVFTVYLPEWIGKQKSIETPKQKKGTITGDETVLVVEDDDSVRNLICTVLTRFGYKPIEARNAGEALLLSEQHEGVIHLLITDIILPIIRGDELVLRLKSVRSDMKCLFMSGYADMQGNYNDSALSSIDFIQKPFDIDTFINKVREVLDSKQ